VADLTDAGVVRPVADALPPGPVVEFVPGAAARLVNLAALPITAAFRTTAFVNRTPSAFLAETMGAKLFVVRNEGVVGAAAGAGVGAAGAASSSLAPPLPSDRSFTLLWEDDDDFAHITVFTRHSLEL